MSYNPYNQGPSAESGYGYNQPSPDCLHVVDQTPADAATNHPPQQQQQDQYEMQSYGGQQYGSPYGNNQPYDPPQQRYGMAQQPQQSGHVLSQNDFLQRVSAIRQEIQSLTANIRDIETLHGRALADTDGNGQSQLDALIAETQLKNTSIRGQIQSLKSDTERTQDGSFNVKKRQFESLNNDFKETIQNFLREEQAYKQRYREQIARQYRIVNPQATEAEVQQAADADWGDEGIFQTALRTNRSGQASAVLGNVRARHNDMLKIERSISELLDLLELLNQQIVQQGNIIEDVAQKAEQTTDHLGNANVQISKGVEHARRARRMKWWCLGICVLIILIIALAVGLYFGLRKASNTQ
ncbi:t-SNARE [Podospora fimiseda]|uniref:t-SNARE n=1 Tax=Podospora fimiseda TaxID=252190 RepID=A0AAN6YSI7_9PEZI|nr:t-SNARE [Podospora fimiseda]